MVRFDNFELDVRAGELRRDGERVNLPPQQFRMLEVLTAHPGVLVTRDQLRQALWGDDQFVDFNAGLNFCVRQLRLALGDDASQPRYVETVPRRGYRFVAAIDAADDLVVPPTSGRVIEARASKLSWSWVALAVAGLAVAGVGLSAWTLARTPVSSSPMTEQNRRIADAHAALGFVALNDDWDWAGAERALLRSIALDPTHEVALISLSRLRSAQARGDEAVDFARRAATAWPESARARANLGWTLLYAGRPAEAIDECLAALALRPQSRSDRQCVLNAHVDLGDQARALEDFTQIAEESGAPTGVADELQQRFRVAGVAGLWQWRLEQMARVGPTSGGREPEGLTYSMAMCNARLGRTEDALVWLRKAVAESRQASARRPDAYMFMAVHPAFASLRRDSRFVSLAAELGLPTT